MVKDGLGRKIVLAAPARRIAALSPSHLEILFAIGCGDQVVLRDRRADHPPAALRLPASDGLNPSAEHVAGYRPDLVLLSHVDANRLEGLTRVGLQVAVFDPTSVEMIKGDMEAVGRLCGASKKKVSQVVARFDRRLAAALAWVKDRSPVRTYLELDGADPAKPWTVGKGALLGDVLRLAGGINVFAAVSRAYAQVSAEEVLRAAPAAMVLVNKGRSPRKRPGWSSLPALKRDRVISHIDPDLLSRPGPRIADGVWHLARALHPAPPAGSTP